MTVTQNFHIINVEYGEPEELLDAYLNGLHQEEAGNVDVEGYHYYRVGRFVVETNSSGSHVTAEFNSYLDAEDFMETQRIEAT